MTLRLAWRRLTRQWTASAFTILALGLTGGATGGAAVFHDALARRPLPIAAPERLISVTARRGEALLGLPPDTLAALATATPVVERLCGYARGAAVVTLGGRDVRRSLEGFTASCAGVLGVTVARGRWLSAVDEPPGAPAARVVVVSDGFRRAAFGEAADVIGRSVRVDTLDLTVIGVLPPGVHGLHVDQGPDLIVPRGLLPALVGLPGPLPALYAIGRLAPGVSLAAARADLAARWPALQAATAPGAVAATTPTAAGGSTLDVQSASRGLSDLRTQYGAAARLFFGLAAALLGMAASSVAAHFATRAAGRAAEFAVRGAMGAPQARVAGEVALDAALVGALAGVVAAALAAALPGVVLGAIWTSATPLTLAATASPAGLGAIAAATCALAVALAVPAMIVARRATTTGLTAAHPRLTRGTVRPAGLALQAAGATALVVAALALGRNVVDLQAIDPGYDPDGLAWTTLDRQPGAPPVASADAYAATLLERVGGVPGVEAAALSASFPLMPVRALTALIPAATAGGPEVPVAQARVSPGFFDVVGVPLVAGVDLGTGDRGDGPADAVLSRRAASLLFGETSPLDRPLTIAGRPYRVAGIVGDLSPGDVRLAGVPVVFTSVLREPALLRTPVLVVRQRAGAAPPATALEDAVRAAGRHLAGPLRPVRDHLTGQLARERVTFGLALVLAVAAVAVAGAGLYATLADAARRRRRDLAVRLALGATRPRAVAAACGPLLGGVAAGICAGLPLAWAIARAARPLFFRVAPFDAWAVAAGVAVMAGVALAAAAAPVGALWRLAPARWLHDAS